MKKLIALTLAGVMICALPVCAAESPSAAVVATSASTVEAASAGKTVGEYTNNAVVEVPGLTETTPLGQGGHVIINGAPSNVTFFLTKPTEAAVTSAKSQAQVLGGKVLNVVGTTSQVITEFGTAQVNFYAKGIKAGQLVKVYQLINGEWVELEVAEIREDHVVVNMTSHGILAFIEVPEEIGAAEETQAAEPKAAEARTAGTKAAEAKTAEAKAAEVKESLESEEADAVEKAEEAKAEDAQKAEDAEKTEEVKAAGEVKESEEAGVTAGAIN